MTFHTSSHKFHSGGREDIDVRMLEGGRPFILEIMNPTIINEELDELCKRMEKEINFGDDGNMV